MYWEKQRPPFDVHRPIIDRGRREFLIRSCQWASATLIPPAFGDARLFSLFGESAVSERGEFHLHPHYRTPNPLDPLLLKVLAENDDFIMERYAEQIEVILARWKVDLLQGSPQTTAIENSLAQHFVGGSWRVKESRVLRSGAPVEVRRNRYEPSVSLNRADFSKELRSSLAHFSKLVTVDLQITRIETDASEGANSSRRLRTLVRSEIVGMGNGFHLEQRIATWSLDWESPSGEFRVSKWQSLDETQSRSQAPVYADITAAVLGRNTSYSAQLLHGADYWRTVLDGACGIDLYGHNGVAVGDIDGDGFDDLYVCQPGGLPNRLYRNRGDGTFEDVTEKSGVGVLENTACALFVDVDNDGRQDLIVVRTDGPMLFLNDGAGHFHQKANAFRFANAPQGTFTGAATADYDRDGWLDIYFCLYIYYQGTDQYKYPLPYYAAENGPPNFMMRNNRDGTFRDVTREAGLDKNNTRYSFCCSWNDYNRDGWPDLYVVNDFGRKNLYRNNGDGTFTDVAAQSAVEDVGAGMSVSWFDYDNDGAEDLYVANMWTAAGERISTQDVFKKELPRNVRDLYHKHAMGNSLFRNRDSSPFQDSTNTAGVGVGRWSWSSDAWDFDHDGCADLYVTNGMVSGLERDDLNSFFWRQVVASSPDEAKPSHEYEQGWTALNELIRSDATWSGYERNILYANNRDGTFSDVSGVVGLDFLEDGRAFALADFDRDGRQEIFLKNRNAPQLRVLKNVTEELPPAIAFRLRGTKSNRDAIGAVITIETNIGRQTRVLRAGSGFLSQHSKQLFFGLGTAKGLISAEIRWPNGVIQNFHDLPSNHGVLITEGNDTQQLEPFANVSSREPGSALLPATQPSEADSLPIVAETWLVAPVPAPEFSLADSTGKTRTLSSFRRKPLLLSFWVTGSSECVSNLGVLQEYAAGLSEQGLQLLAVNLNEGDASFRAFIERRHFAFPVLRGNDDVAGVYNIVYRYLFDRHRDLILPTSFLLNSKGEIVKIYHGPVDPEHLSHDLRHIPQTPAERMALALPFSGVTDTVEFGRNYLSFGSIYFQHGYFEEAQIAFQRALDDDPGSAEALYGLGSAYLSLQQYDSARDYFARTIKGRSSYPDTLPNAWNNLGLIAAREGRIEEAISQFQEALRLGPDNIIALNNLGNAFRQKKDWVEAKATFLRALALNANDAEANYGLGMVYAQSEDAGRTEEYLNRALKARPGYPEALNNLGILYLRTHRRDQAVSSFEECIRVAPSFDQAYLNLARVYAIEDTPDKARTVLLALLKQHPDHEAAKTMLANLTNK